MKRVTVLIYTKIARNKLLMSRNSFDKIDLKRNQMQFQWIYVNYHLTITNPIGLIQTRSNWKLALAINFHG